MPIELRPTNPLKLLDELDSKLDQLVNQNGESETLLSAMMLAAGLRLVLRHYRAGWEG